MLKGIGCLIQKLLTSSQPYNIAWFGVSHHFADNMHGCSSLAGASRHMNDNSAVTASYYFMYLLNNSSLVWKKSKIWSNRLTLRQLGEGHRGACVNSEEP